MYENVIMYGAEVYTPSQLVEIFHRVPHINITLHFVNSTFNPSSDVYIESLGIIASVPGAWLILTLLVLLLYLLTRCCDRGRKKRHTFTGLKVTLGIFAILCCGAVGVGLYGNDDTHNGVVNVISATKNVDDIIISIKNQTRTVETTLRTEVQQQIRILEQIFNSRRASTNRTVKRDLLQSLETLKGNVTEGTEYVERIGDKMERVHLGTIYLIVRQVEMLRWPVTMAVLSLLLVFCILLLFGVARHSRCTLILFSVFGLFSIILCWLLASVYLATVVALSDLCMDPNSYVESQLVQYLEGSIVDFYLTCSATTFDPFISDLRNGQKDVEIAESTLHHISRVAQEFFRDEKLMPTLTGMAQSLNETDRILLGMGALLDCQTLHKQYLEVVDNMCGLTFYGLTFMLASAAGAGFLFTILVWIDSHTWIYIKKRREYHHVEEQDPFLPSSVSTRNGRLHREKDDKSRPIGRGTPPPSVSSPPPLLAPNNGQYATLSKQCKTLESSDFY